MKQNVETPDVLKSIEMLGEGASPITAEKAGGYKTVSGMRSAIRAYERAYPPQEKGENVPEARSTVLHNRLSTKDENPVTEAMKPSESESRTTYTVPIPYTVRKKREIDRIYSELCNAEKGENRVSEAKTAQEIVEAEEPLRTIETSNFRLSYRAKSKSLRITIRAGKSNRYLQIKSSDARELYAALGFMVSRYDLDKDGENEQE